MKWNIIVYLAIFSSLGVDADGDNSSELENFAWHGAAKSKGLKVKLERIFNHQAVNKLETMEYVGQLQIGYPSKKFQMKFDTNADELWVPKYYDEHSDDNLHHSEGFDCDKSRNCRSKEGTFIATYRGLDLEGGRYVDTLALKRSSTGRPHPFEHEFLVVCKAHGSNLKDKQFDGVVGLAPVQSDGSTNSFLKTIFATLHSSKERFAFQFNADKSSVDGGELIIGGADPTRHIHYHPLRGTDNWRIMFSSIALGDDTLCESKCKAVIDTGVNWLSGPRSAVRKIRHNIEAFLSDGQWRVDCDTYLKGPSLTIDGNAYWLGPEHYITKIESEESDICILAIKENDGRNWILGTPFMLKYYTVFDFGNRKIGFAELTPEY